MPALAQARAPRHQFMDLVGDGHLDCAVLERPGAGFYERTAAEGWEPFTPLESAPNVDWNDPNLRLIDVDGDGFSDILITAQDSLTYFPSLARFGFGAPIRLPKATDEEAGPAVIFADSTQSDFPRRHVGRRLVGHRAHSKWRGLLLAEPGLRQVRGQGHHG